MARRERKFAAALFADVVGSTSLAETHDPEIVAELLGHALERIVEQVERHGGMVERVMGDGLLALFGVPQTHEDDCERAVRAALEMHATISELNRQPGLQHRPDLEIHVGIEAGEILIGLEGDVTGRMFTGDSINTAARLEDVARAGEVVVGTNVYLATQHIVEYESLEPLTLKGKGGPVDAWIAKRIRARSGAARPRLELSAPLIGRDEENTMLRKALARVESEGRPVLVTVLGPAGVGKSRLGWELLDHVDSLEQTFYWRAGRCLPYGGAPYGALAEAVKSHCEVLENDDLETAVRKVGRAVEDLFGEKTLLPEMLTLVGAGGGESFSRERLFDAWRRFLERMAARYPLVLMFEDMQWADDGLLDLVDHLADWADGPLFLLTTARPELLERRPSWGGGKRNYTVLYLDPLTALESEEVLSGLVGPGLPAEVSRLIVDRCEGNPLYAEEIVRHFIDNGIFRHSGDGWSAPASVEDVEIPRSIQSLIAARMDMLTVEEKSVLQDAAVIGRGFWEGALGRLDPDHPSDISAVLQRLRRKEMIVPSEPSSFSGEQEFSFRHALIRDVAYDSLPKSTRAVKHALVARWAEERTGERRDESAWLIATHYSRALALRTDLDEPAEGRSRLAAELFHWSLAAARYAAQLWQHKQAVRWYRETIALFDEVGTDAATRAEILDAYAVSTLGTERYEETAAAHEAALAAYEQLGEPQEAGRIEARLAQIAFESSRDDLIPRVERALERLEPLGDSEALASVLHVLGWYHWRRGHYEEAEPQLRRAADIAQRVSAPTIRGHALQTVGVLLVDRNKWQEGIELLEESYEIAKTAGNLDLLLRACHNLPNVLAHFLPGFDHQKNTTGIERARQILDEGLELARRGGNRRWESGILAMTAWVLKNSGRLEQAEEYAAASLDSARAISSSSLIGEHLLDLALIKIDRGDHDGAKDLYLEAKEILRHHPEPGNEVWVALAGAPIAIAKGDEEGALELLLSTVRSLGDNISVYGGEWLVHHTVRVLRSVGRPDEARSLIAAAKPLLLGRPISEAAIEWSEQLLVEDDLARSAGLIDVAARFEALGWKVDRARCLLDAAAALARAGEDADAITKEAREVLDTCGAGYPTGFA